MTRSAWATAILARFVPRRGASRRDGAPREGPWVRAAAWAAGTSPGRQQRWPSRVWPAGRVPARAGWPGAPPAQEATGSARGTRLLAVPLAATSLAAGGRAPPGLVSRRPIAAAPGVRIAGSRASHRAIGSSRRSICPHRAVPTTRGGGVTRPSPAGANRARVARRRPVATSARAWGAGRPARRAAPRVRPEPPSRADAPAASVRWASSRRVCPRGRRGPRARMKGRRERGSSRRSRDATGGMTLARHRPGGRRSARQAASWPAGGRPGPALPGCALTSPSSPGPARRVTPGFPSAPGLASAPGVQPHASSPSERAHTAAGLVRKGRGSGPAGLTPPAPPGFLGTSQPAPRADTTCRATSA